MNNRSYILIGLVIFLFSFSRQAYARQGDTAVSSVEFRPQVSLVLFTAEKKLSGKAFGGELIYHLNKRNNARPWMDKIHLKGIDLIFNYKNMRDARVKSDPQTSLFGEAYAFIAGLNFSLLNVKRTELSVVPGFGLGYLSTTYFTNGNPLIGSHINFSSRLALNAATRITNNLKLSIGVDILHFSNGAMRIPNNGININSLSFGLVKMLRPGKELARDSVKKPIDVPDHKHSFEFGVNIGRRGIFRSKAGLFRTGLYAGYNYRFNEVFGLGTGIDAVYYPTTYDYTDRTYQSMGTSLDHWRVGIAFGPDFWMDRFGVMAKYGYYLHYHSYYKGVENSIKDYWTIGLKYRVWNQLALQAKVYLHQTDADYTGFGVLFGL